MHTLTYFHLHGLLQPVHPLGELAQHGAQEPNLLVLLVDGHLELTDLIVGGGEEVLDTVVGALTLG